MTDEPKLEQINPLLQAAYLVGLVGAFYAYVQYPVERFNTVFGFYLFFFGLFLSLNLVPFFRWLAIRLDVFDHPNARKMHTVATPLLGGLAIFFAFVGTFVMFHTRIHPPEVFWYIIGASFVILVLGAIDDHRTLSSKLRLAVQVLAAGIVIYKGVRITFLPDHWVGDTFEIVLSVLWIVGITNAINFLDGMDGLAPGYVIICASILGFVAYQLVMPEYLYLLLALIGACLGFLPFNFRIRKSALVFLGDSGATFLGFLLACLCLEGKWGSRNDVYHSINEVGVVIPLLVLGVAVFDTTFTLLTRLLEGKIKRFEDLLTYAGKDHFHHRLHDFGLPDKGAVMIIFLITLGLGLGSIALKNARKVDAIIILIQAVIVFVLIGFFMRFVEVRFVQRDENGKPLPTPSKEPALPGPDGTDPD